jgi:predicted dehydrogenase
MPYSAMIVGFGNSGNRFLRASTLVGTERSRIEVTCIVDRNEKVLKSIIDAKVEMHLTTEQALSVGKYDVIVICTTDSEHFCVFDAIRKGARYFHRVISEKPIAETLHQASQLKSSFNNDAVLVNFTERFSPAVTRLREWLVRHGLHVTRAAFFWGKYRIHDHRPTMGIMSEVTHPLDLILYIAGVPVETDFEVINATIILSDFARTPDPLLDSIDLAIEFSSGLLVTGSCSYMWSDRDRRVLVYLGAQTGVTTHLAVLTFDTPLWDIDKVEIFDLRQRPGQRTQVELMAVTEGDLPPRRAGINKLCLLLESVILELDGQRCEKAARLDQAVYVQRILDAVAQKARSPHSWKGHFAT